VSGSTSGKPISRENAGARRDYRLSVWPHDRPNVGTGSIFYGTRRPLRGGEQVRRWTPDPRGTRPAARVWTDYERFREALIAPVSGVPSEDRQQRHAREEQSEARREVLKDIGSYRAAYVQVASEVGMAICVFTLLLNWTLSIELVKPAFAYFLVASFLVYWAMAWVKRKRTTPTCAVRASREEQG